MQKSPVKSSTSTFVSLSFRFVCILTVLFLCSSSFGPAIAAERFSAIVLDRLSGAVLFSEKPDEPRYPASLAKVMTL
jgi:D-alanyl-D-alanine carboxypeptidase